MSRFLFSRDGAKLDSMRAYARTKIVELAHRLKKCSIQGEGGTLNGASTLLHRIQHFASRKNLKIPTL